MTGVKAEGWYIDGSALSDYVTISDRDGWDDTPPLRGDNLTLLGRHGTVRRRKRYDAGKKTLNVTVNGVEDDGWSVPADGRDQRALYEANLDAFLRIIAPGYYRALSVERVHANGDRRQADCEITSAITPAELGNTAGQFSIELGVPGAFWADVDAQPYLLPYVVGTGGTQTLEVYSLAGQNAPCSDPIVSITGPCASVAVHDVATGTGFTYPIAIAGGQTLTVDAGAITAVKAGSSVLTDLTFTDQQILELAPAPQAYRGPQVTVTAAGVADGFTVLFTTRRKWLR